MINYYLTDRGYIATDSSVKLQANGTSTGNTLVFGRGPVVGWNLGKIADAVFIVGRLGEPVTTVPPEWRKALGFETPVVVPKSQSLAPITSPKVEELDPVKFKVFISFWLGVIIGITAVYMLR